MYLPFRRQEKYCAREHELDMVNWKKSVTSSHFVLLLLCLVVGERMVHRVKPAGITWHIHPFD